jgi:hypothetical protein
MKPTTAAKVSRAAIAQIAKPSTTAAGAISRTVAMVMKAVRLGGPRAQ